MRINESPPELAEFVSDYWRMYEDGSLTTNRPPTARSIALAYCEAAIAHDANEKEYAAAVKEMTPQIAYYLPAR